MTAKHLKMIERYCKRYAFRHRVTHVEEDMIGYVVLKMLENSKRKTKTLEKGCMRNMCIDFMRYWFGATRRNKSKIHPKNDRMHVNLRPDHALYEIQYPDILSQAKVILSKRDFKILSMVFIEGMTHKEICVKYNLSDTRICQILSDCISRIKISINNSKHQ